MSTLKTLSIVGLATLPLAVFTVMAFIRPRDGGSAVGDEPSVPASVAMVVDKAKKALQAKAATEDAVKADPAGFRAKAGDAAAGPPYSTAAALVEAEAATRAEDLDRTTRALAGLANESAVPVELRPEIAKRRHLLERHATWLRNRAYASNVLRGAGELLRSPASIPSAAKATETLDELRRRLPRIASADATASEPADALTAEEAAEASQLREWAVYRSEFLSLKAKHVGLEKSDIDTLKAVVDGWDEFLARYGVAGVSDPDGYVAESRRLRTEGRLTFLWAAAVACDTPDSLAQAVLAWLDEPRFGAGGGGDDSGRRDQATSLLRTWLERNLPSPPPPPNGLAGMQEGIIDDQQAGKRLIAVFQAVPGQPRRYRWWYSAAERKELPLGSDSGFLQSAPSAPRCFGWTARYRDARDAYLTGFMRDDGSFASECRALAQASRSHMELLPLDGDKDVTASVAGWGELFSAAADRAASFQQALSASGLKERLGKPSP